MSLISRSVSISTSSFLATRSQRTFSTAQPKRASILFALNALSNSRETQHFNKLSRLSRIEHSPPLKLIQTSEVDAHPLPTPPPRIAAPFHPRGTSSTARAWDDRALKVGQAVLANQARQISRLQHAILRSKRREARQEVLMQREKLAWQQEARKLRNELRAAGVWIVATIGTATALATWRFWPERALADSGELGRKIAEKARRGIPLPSAGTVGESGGVVAAAPIPTTVEAAPLSMAAPVVHSVLPNTPPAVNAPVPITPVSAQSRQNGGWWSGLLWKQ